MKNKLSNVQSKAAHIVLNEIKTDNTGVGIDVSPAHNLVVLASNYTTDIYVRYERSEFDGQDTGNVKHFIRITFEGNIDYEPLQTQQFQTLADRIHFFANLYEIKL